MEPLVSILIPVFNRENFIEECIRSALTQTYTNIEVVVVDNASNDGTWAICERIATSDQRVKIFRNDLNVGPVRNWICCAKEAKGELSKILFSDDYLELTCLCEMVPYLNDREVAFVYCAARIGKSIKESAITYSCVDSSRVKSTQYLNLVLSGKAPVSPGAVLIRTSDLLKNLHVTFPTSTPRQFERNGAGPDVMIMLLTALSYPFVANISKPLVYFRAHAGSFSVANINNDVVKGYRSALSYYLFNRIGKRSWYIYIGYLWLQQIKLGRKWLSPTIVLREYEGSGSVSEVFILIIFSVWFAVNYIFTKRHLYYGKR